MADRTGTQLIGYGIWVCGLELIVKVGAQVDSRCFFVAVDGGFIARERYDRGPRPSGCGTPAAFGMLISC